MLHASLEENHPWTCSIRDLNKWSYWHLCTQTAPKCAISSGREFERKKLQHALINLEQ